MTLPPRIVTLVVDDPSGVTADIRSRITLVDGERPARRGRSTRVRSRDHGGSTGRHTPHWGREATDHWLDLLGLDRAAWVAFRPLAAIRLAIVYQRFCDGIEPSEQIYHRDDIVPAIRAGLSFLDA